MIRRTLAATFVVALASCGGSAGSPTLDTGLARDVPADQVTPAEAQAACQAYEDLANQALGVDVQQDVACTVAGIASQLTGGASCSTSRAQCLLSAPAGTTIDFQCEAAVTFAPSGCTATIGELEDCVNAVARDIDTLTSHVSCSLVNDPGALADLAQVADTIVAPAMNPACAGLSMECLDLLGWTADATPPITAGP